MMAVIFELEPKPGKADAYFDVAGSLKSHLEAMDGFISVERFESVAAPGKFLSLSFWRDEAALEAWRNLTPHRGAQSTGRGEIFADYRLRVAHVVRDYGLHRREDAPQDSRGVHG